MLREMEFIRLVSLMSNANFYIFIKYMNGNYEIVAETSITMSAHIYLHNKHFYLKNGQLYYWETKINSNIETGVEHKEVYNLYKINIDKDRINQLYEMMHDNLLEELGPDYSHQFVKRTDRLFDRFTSNELYGLYIYNHKNGDMGKMPLEISNGTIPSKLKRTKIKIINSILLSYSSNIWKYCIDYKLINMNKI